MFFRTFGQNFKIKNIAKFKNLKKKTLKTHVNQKQVKIFQKPKTP